MSIYKIARYARKLLWWQFTVTEVRFLDESGSRAVLHVHPAWHSSNRIMDDAIAQFLPGYERLGRAERTGE